MEIIKVKAFNGTTDYLRVYEEKELVYYLLNIRRIAKCYFEGETGAKLLIMSFETTDNTKIKYDEGLVELNKPSRYFKSKKLFYMTFHGNCRVLPNVNSRKIINVSESRDLIEFRDSKISKKNRKKVAKKIIKTILEISSDTKNVNYAMETDYDDPYFN